MKIFCDHSITYRFKRGCLACDLLNAGARLRKLEQEKTQVMLDLTTMRIERDTYRQALVDAALNLEAIRKLFCPADAGKMQELIDQIPKEVKPK